MQTQFLLSETFLCLANVVLTGFIKSALCDVTRPGLVFSSTILVTWTQYFVELLKQKILLDEFVCYYTRVGTSHNNANSM